MKSIVTAVATGAIALAAPAIASAAEMAVQPAKPCYGSSEVVNLLGSGFTPASSVNVTRGTEPLGTLSVDAAGAFNGTLTLAQRSGRETRTYTATDVANPALTAAVQLTVSELDVNIRPRSGAPGRRVTINAEGFTSGRQLWAHVKRGRSVRHIKIGRLKRACHVLKKKRRLLRPNAPTGVYTVQFDTFRRYRANRRMKVRFSVTVRRIVRPAAAAAAVTWNRLP